MRNVSEAKLLGIAIFLAFLVAGFAQGNLSRAPMMTSVFFSKQSGQPFGNCKKKIAQCVPATQ